ncbi:hypothetical protein D3C76_1450170 [compost metagenome]
MIRVRSSILSLVGTSKMRRQHGRQLVNIVIYGIMKQGKNEGAHDESEGFPFIFG